jgi:hypothetical protein
VGRFSDLIELRIPAVSAGEIIRTGVSRSDAPNGINKALSSARDDQGSDKLKRLE